jgi:hypothetical protein
VGHCGYCEGEIVADFSAEVQEPQKRAERGDQRLRGRDPTLASPFQKKVSNNLCIPLGDILTESPE